jgi:hypothetical protein
MQEQPYVRHDAHRLCRTAIGQLRDDGGLMSTHTTRTHDGNMLPTPMLCSIDDSMSTSLHVLREGRR